MPGASNVEEFCQAHKISRGTFYNLIKEGLGPRVMKVGARTLVSDEAAADWRRQMETSSHSQGVDEPRRAV